MQHLSVHQTEMGSGVCSFTKSCSRVFFNKSHYSSLLHKTEWKTQLRNTVL